MKYTFIKFALTAVLALTASYTSAMGTTEMAAKESTHQAKKAKGKGTVISLDAGKGIVKLKHDPIPELGWPVMTMQFKVQDSSSLSGLNKDDRVEFVLEQKQDEYAITSIKRTP